MGECAGVYDEWRVTGEHTDPRWREFVPAYDFTWSARINPRLGADNAAAEAAAREFAELARTRCSLTDVRLHHRTVTITEWTAAALEERGGNGGPTETSCGRGVVDPDGR